MSRGIVLDISLRHLNKKRIIDSVKKAIITILPEDDFYLYNPNNIEATDDQGKKTHMVASYEPTNFNLGFALRQTLYVLATLEMPRELFLITDRLKDMFPVEMVKNYECKIKVIGIGNYYLKHPDIIHCDPIEEVLKWLK